MNRSEPCHMVSRGTRLAPGARTLSSGLRLSRFVKVTESTDCVHEQKKQITKDATEKRSSFSRRRGGRSLQIFRIIYATERFCYRLESLRMFFSCTVGNFAALVAEVVAVWSIKFHSRCSASRFCDFNVKSPEPSEETRATNAFRMKYQRPERNDGGTESRTKSDTRRKHWGKREILLLH